MTGPCRCWVTSPPLPHDSHCCFSYPDPDGTVYQCVVTSAIVHTLIAIAERLETLTAGAEESPEPEYSRCPRCGVEHTDQPGKLCYHCGLEPAGEPETVQVLLSQHRDRVWRGAIPTGNATVWLKWMEGGWWCASSWPATYWSLYLHPQPPEVRFGPFTAVEEA